MIPTVETFDTAPIQEGARLRYWNHAAKNVFDAIEVEPASRHFAGRMRRRTFGSVQLATVNSTPVAIHGLRSSKRKGIYLLINERGSCTLHQRERQSRLLTGELGVLCAHEPYRIESSREHRTHVLFVPGQNLDSTLDEQIAVAHRGTESALISAFIARLGNLDMRSDSGDNLLDTTLNLIRLTWPNPLVAPGRASASAWRKRLRQHIDQHLNDPDLGSESIGAHFGISPRYVQMVFAQTNTKVSEYILDRRMEAVAAALRENDRRIGDIAFDAGFNDLSHFCRKFRERFGVSARQFRSQHAVE